MHAFRAMNTDVAVVAGGDEAAIAGEVAGVFARAEERFSRFRADSELSRLNRAHGLVVVSEALFAALVRARNYLELTDGLFDPAIGGVLAALGYDRSFSPGSLDRESAAPLPGPGSFRDVDLDPATRSVLRPDHVTIDLGGMIKGATVDASAASLRGPGAVDAGGDAVLLGEWCVEVEDPLDPGRTVATVVVRDAAVATSAANRRRWRVGASTAHHLIDPRARGPAETDLLQVTVIAASAELAEVLAKTAFLLGVRAGTRFLERQPGVGAVLVDRESRRTITGTVEEAA